MPALAHFMIRITDGSRAVYTVGGRRPAATTNTPLPFQKIEVWPGLRIQMKDFHNPSIVHPPQTLCAWPPSADWPVGRFDNALVNVDPEKEWPFSKISGMQSFVHPPFCLVSDRQNLSGHCVARIRLVFRIIHPTGSEPHPESPLNGFLAYVQWFDIVPQARTSSSGLTTSRGCCPDSASKMYVLKRGHRTDGSWMGDVIPLTHIRANVDLVPRYMHAADVRLTKESSLEYSSEFLLNDFFDKQLYYSLRET